MSQEPAVLFVKPGAIKQSDKRQLSKAGIVVVEIDDPNAVKLVRAGYEVSRSDLLAAAAGALKSASYSTQQAFCEAVCDLLIASKDEG